MKSHNTQDLGASSEISLNQYLLSACRVPGADLGPRAQHGGNTDGVNIPVEPESAGEGSKKTEPSRAVGLHGHRGERVNGTAIRSGRYSRGTDIRRT